MVVGAAQGGEIAPLGSAGLGMRMVAAGFAGD